MDASALGEFEYRHLKSFGYLERSLGNYPSELLEASDGRLFGTTEGGGTHNAGTVFRLIRDGSDYTVLHTFSRNSGDGANLGRGWDPAPGLVEGEDGWLYGTTLAGGGIHNAGTVFKLNKDGAGHTVLHRFTSSGLDAIFPSTLILGSDDALYGSDGAVFKLNTDGTGFQVLHTFAFDEGVGSQSLVEGSDGALYGTCFAGGLTTAEFTAGMGTVFKLSKDGSAFRILHRFTGTAGDGRHPTAPLVKGPGGVLYGTTSAGGAHEDGTVFKFNPNGTAYTTVTSFSEPDGKMPWARLVAGIGEELYGTSLWGGAHEGGTVFKVTPEGVSVLHNFALSASTSMPNGLLHSRDGALYGSTVQGGTNAAGSIFKLNLEGGNFTVLHEFSAPRGGDAAYPTSALLEGRDGALYGMTMEAGPSRAMLYKLNRDGGDYSVVLSVSGARVEARPPVGPLVEGRQGELFGSTDLGGAHDAGTVFTVQKDGTGYRVLHSFPSTPGWGIRAPNVSGLVTDRDGVLYGTTAAGGVDGAGDIFKLDPHGSGYEVLHDFDAEDDEGFSPREALLLTSDGLLYGTTYSGGGTDGRGTVFRLSTNGTGYTVVHTFRNADPTGVSPTGSLVEGSDGALYGTTSVDASREIPATIFKLRKDGSGYAVLHRWSLDERSIEPWVSPGLVEGTDGQLYGITSDQKDPYQSAVFRLNKDGTGYTIVQKPQGGYSITGLVQGTDGALYGTTIGGGDLGLGTVFALRPRPVMHPPIPGPHSMTVRFGSMPRSIHQLQRAGVLDSTWQTLETLIVPQNGVAEFVDPEPPRFGAFYRTLTP
jgi:uncharacterized repeat protein (TIGR03803 family)